VHTGALYIIFGLGLATTTASQSAVVPGFVVEDGQYVPLPSQPPAGLAPKPWFVPFPPMPGLEENPVTPEKVELGRLLFFDPLLSGDNTMSCATCHHPDFGLADGRGKAMGFGGKGFGPDRAGGTLLGRQSPTLWNAAYNAHQFWDGRARLLEHQAAFPIQAPDEMNQDADELVDELSAIPEYVRLFEQVFGPDGEPVTFENVTKAVAVFERTLLTFRSRFDRFAAGEEEALTPEEKRGFELFRSDRMRCIQCHHLPTFSDTAFRVIGVPEEETPDPGRAKVPGEGPFGAFKVPALRNASVTGPYMHNGHFDTLESIIDFYAGGAGLANEPPAENVDPLIRPFRISAEEKAALVSFLNALTDLSLQPAPPGAVPSGLPVIPVGSRLRNAP